MRQNPRPSHDPLRAFPPTGQKPASWYHCSSANTGPCPAASTCPLSSLSLRWLPLAFHMLHRTPKRAVMLRSLLRKAPPRLGTALKTVLRPLTFSQLLYSVPDISLIHSLGLGVDPDCPFYPASAFRPSPKPPNHAVHSLSASHSLCRVHHEPSVTFFSWGKRYLLGFQGFETLCFLSLSIVPGKDGQAQPRGLALCSAHDGQCQQGGQAHSLPPAWPLPG